MSSATPDETRATLARASSGDAEAVRAIGELCYAELRALARAVLARERPGHTLQATALVHEAWLRLLGNPPPAAEGERSSVDERARFAAIAATCMRRILVEHARARSTEKRGGGAARVTLSSGIAELARPEVDVLELEDALAKLEALDPRQARLVELRFHGGLDVEAAAAVLGVSKRTAESEWALARAFLHRELAR